MMSCQTMLFGIDVYSCLTRVRVQAMLPRMWDGAERGTLPGLWVNVTSITSFVIVEKVSMWIFFGEQYFNKKNLE